jgi:preprotein translocase subunit SecE
MASVMNKTDDDQGSDSAGDAAESAKDSNSGGLAKLDYRAKGAARQQAAVAPSDGGFFTIYKKGQGYWTRMGTVFGAALVIFLTASFLFDERRTIGITSDQTAYIIIAIFTLAAALGAFYLMNKPDNADFLIATDSEMKKVNWTSRKELIGSTKVVIGFMFVVAAMLFVFDVVFGYLFYFMHVLKVPPL